MRTVAIIVAAGSGSRFRSDKPKQFLEINGRSVLAHTIGRFESAPSVDSIVIVLAADHVADFDHSGFSKVIAVVAGGETRADSVLRGLKEAKDDAEIIAVHDGARPLVTVHEIEATIEMAKETGAACLVAPVTDTIKSVRGGEIAATLDRDKLRRALTPQAFKTHLLCAAFENADLAAATDECYLVEKLGHPIAVVEGSPRNIKITHPEDLVLAEALLSSEEPGHAALPD
jgi:2-C-methyl-D-erythritol 4-phosphate cytidylyltransferase